MGDSPRQQSSIRRLPARIVITLAILMALLMPAGAALATGTGPVTEASASFPVAAPPLTPFDEVQLVLEFPIGAGVPMHHHGGNGYITMLDGELMLTANGVTTTYRAGDSFVEYPDGHYKGWNATNAPARLLVTYLVPTGAAVTTPEEEAPAVGPKTVSQAKHEVTNPPAPFELIQTIQRYEPGDQTGLKSTAGDLLLTVVEGSLTARMGEDEKTYAAGESLTAPTGQVVATANNGATPAVIATTELRPATPAITPSAGRPAPVNGNWLLLATGSGTHLAGLLMRQRARHR